MKLSIEEIISIIEDLGHANNESMSAISKRRSKSDNEIYNEIMRDSIKLRDGIISKLKGISIEVNNE